MHRLPQGWHGRGPLRMDQTHGRGGVQRVIACPYRAYFTKGVSRATRS